MRKARVAVVAIVAAGGIAACFPAFDFGDGASDGGGTPNGSPDATLDQASPGDANGAVDALGTPDSSGSADAGSDGDAGADVASPVPFDASDMIYIEAGSFLFDNNGSNVAASFTHDFLVDKYEVTNARFAAWIDAGQNPPCDAGTCSLDPSGPYESAMIWLAAWNDGVTGTSYTNDGTCGAAEYAPVLVPDWAVDGGDRFPVSCVNWYQAASFCAFEGKRLLTESEWAYVASGRGAGRGYPWGNTLDPACDRAIWSYIDAGENNCHWPVPVGSTPNGASLDGVFDMSGSEFEWVWDWFDPQGGYTGGPDYTGFAEDGGRRLDRGGSWASEPGTLTTSDRDPTDPSFNFEDLGVRCARSL